MARAPACTHTPKRAAPPCPRACVLSRSFFAASFLTTLMFYQTLLQVDEEALGGHTELLSEGAAHSLGSFLLTWILTYSCVHH